MTKKERKRATEFDNSIVILLNHCECHYGQLDPPV